MASIVVQPEQAQAARTLLAGIANGRTVFAAPPGIVSYARADAP
ncbi:MAG TPA: hypothetical protein VGH48_15795 [Caldimonas sp.]|jgi:hypothetical protein